ncbi:MAG: alpha-1,2-fucosyltransferase [Ferruginibacter sp.]
MSIVICKLPKAGLGNQLFPLLKAYTFADLNKLPIVVTGYNRFFIGPYLRREKSKRKYNGTFIFQKNILAAGFEKWRLSKYKKHDQIIEPPIEQLGNKGDLNHAYIFYEMPHWDHYFDGLKEQRTLVIKLLWQVLLSPIRKKVLELPPPCIGIHIRMGDFRNLRDGETFGSAGAVRTPENYFINLVKSIREIHGSDLPVSVFTDGSRRELDQLFQLSNITLIEGKSDMVDLLLLSKSKLIITSAGSTFSYWAAFLSDAIVIMHPTHVNTVIRPPQLCDTLYQGAFNTDNMLLMNSIRNIT